MAKAPPVGASLAQIEAYQATIPRADFTNPQIAALLKAESEQTLGGYFNNIPIYAYIPGTSGSGGTDSVGPKLMIAVDALWVPNSSSVPVDDNTIPPWTYDVGIAGSCLSAGAGAAAAFADPPIGALSAMRIVGNGAVCIAGIESNDQIASVAQSMFDFLNSLIGIDWTDPVQQQANGASITDQGMNVANLLVPGGYGGSAEASTIGELSSTGSVPPVVTFNDTHYTNDWGNNDYFAET